MKVCKCCNKTLSIDNFIKDKTRTDGLYVYCKACNKGKRKAFREANKDILSVQKKRYYSNNKDSISERKKLKYSLNKTDILFLKNKRLKNSIWKKGNRSIVNTWTAKRRSSKLNASCNWGELNELIITEAYDLAVIRESFTGIKWEVDHVIPLINSKVCGLHVGINLQVIPAIQNRIKSNTYHI